MCYNPGYLEVEEGRWMCIACMDRKVRSSKQLYQHGKTEEHMHCGHPTAKDWKCLSQPFRFCWCWGSHSHPSGPTPHAGEWTRGKRWVAHPIDGWVDWWWMQYSLRHSRDSWFDRWWKAPYPWGHFSFVNGAIGPAGQCPGVRYVPGVQPRLGGTGLRFDTFILPLFEWFSSYFVGQGKWPMMLFPWNRLGSGCTKNQIYGSHGPTKL